MGGSVHSFEIEVDKEELVETLKVNREKHVREFTEAKERYLEACTEAVEARLDLLKRVAAGNAKRKLERYLSFRTDGRNLASAYPQNYAHVYDEVLEMLSYHKPDLIVLSNRQFRAWVKDEWEWKDLFIASTSAY